MRVPITEVDYASSRSGDDSGEKGNDLHLALVQEVTSDGEDGMSHHGDPDTEVEVVEAPGRDETG